MRHFTKWQRAVVSLAVVGLLAVAAFRPAAARVSTYIVVDLGTLGGLESRAYGINQSGRVVGSATASAVSLVGRPFAKTGAVILDMGSFGGPGGTAFAVNDIGYAVGTADLVSSNGHAFIWSDIFGKRDLGVLGSGVFSAAYDINNSNQVVGQSELSPFVDRGFVWDSTNGMREITTLAVPTSGSSSARAINNAGQIVGNSNTNTGATHAFILSGGTMTDLGTLGTGAFSAAFDINDQGEVVGYSTISTGGISPPYHAFVWTAGGGLTDMGHLGGNRSIAYAVNNKGEAVGTSEVSPGLARAFVWDRLAGMRNLNDATAGSGWTLLEARGINDAGQIVGFGINPSGFTHAFLLKPIGDTIPTGDTPPCFTPSSTPAISLPQSVQAAPPPPAKKSRWEKRGRN